MDKDMAMEIVGKYVDTGELPDATLSEWDVDILCDAFSTLLELGASDESLPIRYKAMFAETAKSLKFTI